MRTTPVRPVGVLNVGIIGIRRFDGGWGWMAETNESSDSLFRALLESAPDAMVIVDSDG